MSLSRDAATGLKALDLSRSSPGPGNKHTVQLPCPGCAFQAEDKSDNLVENSMLLTFAISDDLKELLLNNHPVMHESLHSSAIGGESVTNEISIPQIDASANPALDTTRPRSFGYQWQRSVVPAADGADAEIINIDFHVMSLANQNVNTDDLSLRILKDEEGNLRIADVVNVPRNGPAHKEADEDDEQKEFTILPINIPGASTTGLGPGGPQRGNLCNVKAMLAAKVQAIKNAIEAARVRAGGVPRHGRPCPKKAQAGQDDTSMSPPGFLKPAIPVKGGVAKIWALSLNGGEKSSSPEDHQQSQENEQGGPEPPMHGPHHGGSHRSCRMRKVARALHHFLTGFVIPVLVGIAAGMTASLLGMVVGTALAMLWFMIVRGGRRGSASARDEPPAEQANDHEAAMEKKGLMEVESESDDDEGEILPAYQERE